MPSVPWASYFRAHHSIVLSFYPFGEIFLCGLSLGETYFRADHLILHPLASYSNVYHRTLHPSIPLASYFCAIHPLGELCSCQSFNSPVFVELFSYRPYNSPPIHPFGEFFLYYPTLGRVIFVLAVWFSILWRVIFVLIIYLSTHPSLWWVIFALSNPWASYFRAYYFILHSLASYFRADHLTLHPSIPLASYFCATHPLSELFLYCPTLGRVIFLPTI